MFSTVTLYINVLMVPTYQTDVAFKKLNRSLDFFFWRQKAYYGLYNTYLCIWYMTCVISNRVTLHSIVTRLGEAQVKITGAKHTPQTDVQ